MPGKSMATSGGDRERHIGRKGPLLLPLPILEERLQAVEAIADRVVGAPWQALRDLVPLMPELCDAAKDGLVLGLAPRDALWLLALGLHLALSLSFRLAIASLAALAAASR